VRLEYQRKNKEPYRDSALYARSVFLDHLRRRKNGTPEEANV
jgi:hypothetical protein